jgi:hypothetical protein
MTWVQHLKRVLGIDGETCHASDRAVRIITGVADPAVIKNSLTNYSEKGASADAARLAAVRGAITGGVLD